MLRRIIISGRPMRLRPRSLVLILGFLLSVTIFLHLLSDFPKGNAGSRISKYTDPRYLKDSFSANVFHPFRPPAHPPPRQENDSFEGTSWWADWRWRLPFSSSRTLDEDRALLPPLASRPPIYCYYDRTVKKSQEVKAAESGLLLTWRRAWWAKGFRPIILGVPEAVDNPMYREFQLRKDDMSEKMQADVMRWLAWEAMGGGLLADYTLLPMGPWQDALLSYLRRGGYSRLTRWEDLNDGLFAGQKAGVTTALKAALDNPNIKKATSVATAGPKDLMDNDGPSLSMAHYSTKTVNEKYSVIATLMESDRAAGLGRLNELMNTHLHVAWQNTFSAGISVIMPKPEHTAKLVEPAMNLAKSLAQCPESALASSCPPNMPKCIPCDPTAGSIRTSPTHVNDTSLYVIGTVAHPHTFAMLAELRDELTVSWIRLESERNPWINLVTQDLLAQNPGTSRLVLFKEAAAAVDSAPLSFWLVAERDTPDDLAWYFGFTMPSMPSEKAGKKTMKTVKTDKTDKTEKAEKTEKTGSTGSTGKSRQQEDLVKREDYTEKLKEEKTGELRQQGEGDKQEASTAAPVISELDREGELLELAKELLTSKDPYVVTVRGAMEAWNMADMEAWRFARALLGRRTLERTEWEKEEAKYTGGLGREPGAAQ